MTQTELLKIKQKYIDDNIKYECHYFKGYDYSVLKKISTYIKAQGKKDGVKWNDVIIMADTETSKIHQNATVKKKQKNTVTGEYETITVYKPVTNYVVAWSISIRMQHRNIVTLYGNKPTEFIYCVELIMKYLVGEKTMIFFHNLAYDWVFLRKFLIDKWGEPLHQLNTKAHYPICIEFQNGIQFRDSLIIAQRSLDKWGKDLNVEHQKSVGKWDYDMIRHQNHVFTSDEIEYIEHDVLCGVECIDAHLISLNKRLTAIPYTATGIPREQTRKIAKNNGGHEAFKRQVGDLMQQKTLENVYHGGFTHANRHQTDRTITGLTKAFDFASSYPYCFLAYKFPSGKFVPFADASVEGILQLRSDYAFFFKLSMVNVHLKDYYWPMPALQLSKTVKFINPHTDNGRILEADYVEIYMNEIDLCVIRQQYDWDFATITEAKYCAKDYLPRWFTDYVYSLFVSKTELKGKDSVLYAISKSILNSCYGMTVQKPVRNDIKENYESGLYETDQLTADEELTKYEKYVNSFNSILPYQWGVWNTSYAMRNLFALGSCAGLWLYSDTDSCYGQDWNMEKVEAYNNKCKKLLKDNRYGPVLRNGREYWLGVAETSEEDEYIEFRMMGAKRYAKRSKDGQLHITVAGVPKKGAACLKDDINNFTRGFVFDGKTTGKLTHFYIFDKKIRKTKEGDEIGDCIDLVPCDYLLNGITDELSWEDLTTEDVDIPIYEE